jgi:hypothetical protein
MSNACARLDRSSRTAPIILYTGTNAGYQLFVSSSGPDSAAIPYVVTGTGLILGFSGSIIDANLTAGTYLLFLQKRDHRCSGTDECSGYNDDDCNS